MHFFFFLVLAVIVVSVIMSALVTMSSESFFLGLHKVVTSQPKCALDLENAITINWTLVSNISKRRFLWHIPLV